MKRHILLALCLLLLTACSSKQTVVLLPDLDGNVGQIVVAPKKGTPVLLDKPNLAVGDDLKPFTMPAEQIQRIFGRAIEASPEPPTKFILYFLRNSVRMTDESRQLLPDIARAYTLRASSDVAVNGHSDAVGNAEYNIRLSLRRAQAVGKELLLLGIAKKHLHMDSHGEELPMIPTPDGKPEPRNRRVEVLVR